MPSLKKTHTHLQEDEIMRVGGRGTEREKKKEYHERRLNMGKEKNRSLSGHSLLE